jgi:FkbM family methyltransferase
MKKLIRKLLNQFGIDVHRFQPSTSFEAQIVNAMKKVKIDVLFDIGANTGEFSSAIREKGYSGKIVSFEPLTSAIKKLIQLASKDVNWLVHDRTAIGDRKGLVDINISKNSYSSSILPMLNLHLNSEFNSRYIGTEKTPIITLDSVADKYLNKSSNCFIKIDTQGYESQVLDGAYKTLKKSGGVLCELSLAPLYEGQHLWKDIILRLEKEGFILWSLQRGFTDKRDGRTLQVDAVFLKKNLL